MRETFFVCAVCGEARTVSSEGASGYALLANGSMICYECCAWHDKIEMAETGKIVLYLSEDNDTTSRCYLSSWSGTLRIELADMRVSHRHNIAGTRRDVWFSQGGARWHGVQFGENTQLTHCKRLKGKEN